MKFSVLALISTFAAVASAAPSDLSKGVYVADKDVTCTLGENNVLSCTKGKVEGAPAFADVKARGLDLDLEKRTWGRRNPYELDVRCNRGNSGDLICGLECATRGLSCSASCERVFLWINKCRCQPAQCGATVIEEVWSGGYYPGGPGGPGGPHGGH